MKNAQWFAVSALQFFLRQGDSVIANVIYNSVVQPPGTEIPECQTWAGQVHWNGVWTTVCYHQTSAGCKEVLEQYIGDNFSSDNLSKSTSHRAA